MKTFRITMTEGQWDTLQHEYFKYAPSRAEYKTDSDIVEAALSFDVAGVVELANKLLFDE